MKTNTFTTLKKWLGPLPAITKTILITILCFPAFYSLANTTPILPAKNPATENTIKQYFKFPQILLPAYYDFKNSGSKRVEVLFTTDANGTVNFALAKTEDPALKKEVEKQFYKLRLPKINYGTVHSVVLNFKTI